MSERLTWASHPVDALKHIAEQSGMALLPEVEARMRAVCDEEVYACGCSAEEGQQCQCQCQEAQVSAG